MNEVLVFNNSEFGEIRTVVIDGEPWFVGKDLSTLLGYKDNTSAMRNNVDIDDRTVCSISTPSRGKQKMTVVNESGLYQLIFGSKLAAAKRFKKWVSSDVLPTIRKTGSYGQPQLPQTPMQLLELHYQAIKQVDSRVDEVKAELEQFKLEIPIFGEECSEINAVVANKVNECLGGKASVAFQNKKLQRKLYRDIYGQTNRAFGVSTYKAIRRNQVAGYIEAVKGYNPPIGIQSEIDISNAQQTFL